MLRYVEWKTGRGSRWSVDGESEAEAERAAHGLSLIFSNFKGWPLIQGKIEGYQNRFDRQVEEMKERKLRVNEFIEHGGVLLPRLRYSMFEHEEVVLKEQSDAAELVKLQKKKRNEVWNSIRPPPSRFAARPGQQWVIHTKVTPAVTVPTSRFW
jgi:hypothetical protein